MLPPTKVGCFQAFQHNNIESTVEVLNVDEFLKGGRRVSINEDVQKIL